MTSPPHAFALSSPRHDASRWVLHALAFVSFFDRFAASPMLVLMSSQEDVSVGAIAQMIAAYGLAYGLGQPVWGVLGDRLGRRRALLIALCGTTLMALVTVFAPTMTGIFWGRTGMGLCVGGLFPLVLTLIGDTTPAPQRGQAISDLQAAAALGTTCATLVAGVITAATNWRVVIIVVALGAAGLTLVLRKLPLTAATVRTRGSVRAAIRPWPVALYGLGFIEGGLLLGVLTYLAPAIEALGVSASLAGSLIAGYGIAVIAGSRINKTLIRRLPRLDVMIIGALALAAAYLVAGLWLSVASVIAASILVGLSNALLHSGLQTWATEVAPTARSTAVSFFAGALFLGAGAATSIAAPATATGHYAPVFLEAGIVALPFALGLALLYNSWNQKNQTR